MKNYLVILLTIYAAICAGQTVTGTDLRLKKAGTAAGKYSFRFDGTQGTNGALIGMDASGAETSRWDAETGTFTGSSGGGVAWGSITGTLSAQTDLQGALNGKANLTGGNTWSGNQDFGYSATLQAGSLIVSDGIESSGNIQVYADIDVSGDIRLAGSINSSHFDEDMLTFSNGNTLTYSTTYGTDATIVADRFQGSGALLTGLNADNISAGTLPIARGGTGLTALGAAGEFIAVNGAGTGLEFVPAPSGGGGTWGSITGTLSAQTDLQNALNGKQNQHLRLTNFSAVSSNGILAKNSSNGYAVRAIMAGTGISITNADGVSGNPTVAVNTATAHTWTGLQTIQNAGGFLVKSSGASPGWTLMDRSTIPGRQFVFQSNTAETGANKYMVLNFWIAGSTMAQPAANNLNYYWESDPAADAANGRAGVFGLEPSNSRFLIATRNFGANYLSNASFPIEFAAGDNVGGATQLKLEYSGGANKIGFLGAAPVARQTLDYSLSDTARIDAIENLLAAYGLANLIP